MDEWEYVRAGLPRPDQIFFLSVSPATLERLLTRRQEDGRPRDLAERDMAHQRAALTIGSTILPEVLPDYHVIACEDERGDLLAPEVIRERIWECVR